MPNWIQENGATAIAESDELAAERAMRTLLEESYADLEALYREDIGWRRIGAESAFTFTPQGRKQIAATADLFATGNALIKRGLALRTAYVWGQGVQVTIRDDGAEGQDVNAVWSAFWDEPSNRREFTSSEAQVRYERKLGICGEAFWALPTDPVTGRVKVRHIPPAQIVDRICDPEDAATVWFYKRVWTAVTVDAQGHRGTENRTTYYPALGYWPTVRPRSIGGNEVRWDAPMRMVAVNCPDEDWRGVGDVFAALPWARMDKEFLEDLAVYMRAMTRILGQVTAKSKNAATAAARVAAGAAAAAGNPNGVAGWAATDPNTTLSLVSKTGAQIDGETHRPFATMTAAALEVPLTMLLGDPGVTGARATAETLDAPTELMAQLRQNVHQELFRDIADYVIDQAVLAPRGPLRGSVTRDGDRIVVTLPEGDERTVDTAWPEFDSTPLDVLVKSIVAADQTEKLPPLVIVRLLLSAFGVDDTDELIDELTDDQGNWIGPDNGQAATQHASDQGNTPPPVVPNDGSGDAANVGSNP